MRRLVLAPFLVLVVSVGACSSDDTDQPGASPAPAASIGSGGGSGSESGGESGGGSGTSRQDKELTAVIEDANRVTPPLEAYFFGAGPAADLDEAVAALATIELELSPGNQVGSYDYDQADEDFKLCIEGPTGAFATYDTSPMSLFETGESGGCP
jgi:hypothetical protein